MRDSGGQCVIISGGPAMLKWHADSLDSLLMVTYEWCTYLSLCTRLKSFKSWEMFVRSRKAEHF